MGDAAPAPAENLVKDEVTGEMMSKNALKKLQKKREADKKKALKAAEKEAKAAALRHP